MSHQAVTWAYKQDIKPAGAKFILVTLANYADGDGYCFPGQKTLANDTGMSDRAVRNHLDRLERDGIIVRRHRYDKSGNRTSDGCWLVGFKPLPEDVAGSDESLPENPAGRLPEDFSLTTGKKRTHYRKNLPVYIKNEPSEEPSVEPSDVAPAKPTRKRDLLFEAIAEAWLGKPYQEIRLTKTQRGKVNAAASELREIGADYRDVPREWARIRRMFDSPGPMALASNWGARGTGPTGSRASPRGDVIDEEFLDALYPEFRSETVNGDN